jgi:twitching motility protein PilT
MAKIDRLFQYLVSSGGSDLHLSEGAPPKVRVHGGVSVIPEEPILDGEDFKELLS